MVVYLPHHLPDASEESRYEIGYLAVIPSVVLEQPWIEHFMSN
jgi:hypothetical protein